MLRAVYVCVATTVLLALSVCGVGRQNNGSIGSALSPALLPPGQPALLLADGPGPLPPPYPTARVV